MKGTYQDIQTAESGSALEVDKPKNKKAIQEFLNLTSQAFNYFLLCWLPFLELSFKNSWIAFLFLGLSTSNALPLSAVWIS